MYKKRFVIFDLDGTFVDSRRTIINTCGRIMARYRKEECVEMLSSNTYFCNNLERFFIDVATTCGISFDSFKTLYDEEYVKEPLHGTVQNNRICRLLHNERRKGNSIIVLTNKRQDITQVVCDNIIEEGLIDHIMGREGNNAIMPHLVLDRLSRLGIHP